MPEQFPRRGKRPNLHKLGGGRPEFPGLAALPFRHAERDNSVDFAGDADFANELRSRVIVRNDGKPVVDTWHR